LPEEKPLYQNPFKNFAAIAMPFSHKNDVKEMVDTCRDGGVRKGANASSNYF